MDDDIASAAGRVAAATRASHSIFLHADLVALLPVLEAVAAGQNDAGRMERWKVMIGQHVPDRWGSALDDFTRAAMALADAERATDSAADLAKACAEIDRRADEISASVTTRQAEFRAAVREPKGRFKL